METNKHLQPSGTALKTVVLLGTLKRREEFSHTATLSEILVENLAPYNVDSEIVRLSAR